MGKIIVPGVFVRPLLPSPARIAVSIQPQHLHWQVGRYVDAFSIGPGGVGRKHTWRVDKEGEQHNLILNQTYDSLIAQYGILDMVRYAAVGTGSTAPSPTQTQLVNEVARTLNIASGYTYYYIPTRVSQGVTDILSAREFTEAEVGGRNLTEWGFGPRATTTDARLATRELFRDGSNNPIVLTLDADQRLRMLYNMRVTVNPFTPQAATIDITGIGPRTGKLITKFYGPYSGGSTRWREPTGTDPSYSDNFHDITVADWFAMANTSWVKHVLTFQSADPNTYYNSTGFGFSSNSSAKSIAYQSYVAGSRQRLSQMVEWGSGEANATIYGIGVNIVDGSYPSPLFILDSGQEFTKTNLYKLKINAWTLTWGP